MSADKVTSAALIPERRGRERGLRRGRGLGRGLGLVVAACVVGILNFATPPTAFSASTKSAAAPLKVYISVDMEGIAGVVTADQLIPGGFEYERFRRFMTDEAVAAVRGAQAAGATEVVVSDSHGNGESLLIELFPKDVRIIRSWPRHGEMMAGLDSTLLPLSLSAITRPPPIPRVCGRIPFRAPTLRALR